jgi:hypothetical protein
MSDIIITVPEDRLTRLKKKSSNLGINLEDLILLSIEEMLSRPDEDFRQAMNYILQKNKDLYHRLA